jgi:hypothetical protein
MPAVGLCQRYTSTLGNLHQSACTVGTRHTLPAVFTLIVYNTRANTSDVSVQCGGPQGSARQSGRLPDCQHWWQQHKDPTYCHRLALYQLTRQLGSCAQIELNLHATVPASTGTRDLHSLYKGTLTRLGSMYLACVAAAVAQTVLHQNPAIHPSLLKRAHMRAPSN